MRSPTHGDTGWKSESCAHDCAAAAACRHSSMPSRVQTDDAPKTARFDTKRDCLVLFLRLLAVC